MMPHDLDEMAPATLSARDARAWMYAARQGDFATAWTLSDAIRARTTRFGDAAQPRHQQQIWDGTPIEGRRLLVRCYHGLGDTIQFARYLPMARQLARKVVVWAQPALIDLLSTVRADLTLLPLHDAAPDAAYDVDVEIMELAHVFRSTLETLPAAAPYLTVPFPVAEAGAASGATPPRIAVAWRAGDWNATRSVPFERLTPLFTMRGAEKAEWYAIQFDARKDESHPLVRAMPGRSITEIAALMREMDLVISIDSFPAHLAGALGRPVWTLLPYEADWRWLRHRDDSPWYPSMRLFRQPRAGDWDAVISTVAGELSRMLAGTNIPDQGIPLVSASLKPL